MQPVSGKAGILKDGKDLLTVNVKLHDPREADPHFWKILDMIVVRTLLSERRGEGTDITVCFFNKTEISRVRQKELQR